MTRSQASRNSSWDPVRVALLFAAFASSFANAATQDAAIAANAMPPDSLAFVEGHAMMGSETVTWKAPELVFLGTQSTRDGTGNVRNSRRAKPVPADAWQRFWSRVDTLAVWQWKASYTSEASNQMDGAAWSLELTHAGHHVSAKGYNTQPETYAAFREALYLLAPSATATTTAPHSSPATNRTTHVR